MFVNGYRVAIVDARTQVRIGTSDGEIAGRLPAVSTWRGAIAGERGSRVFIASVGGEARVVSPGDPAHQTALAAYRRRWPRVRVPDDVPVVRVNLQA